MPTVETRPPPITRDVTQAWRRFRTQARRSRQSDDHHVYPDSESLLNAAANSDPETPTAREGAILPPQWVDRADEAKAHIKEIREQLARLAMAQQRRLLNSVLKDSPDEEVDAIAGAIKAQIRLCEQCIHQVRTFGVAGRAGGSTSLREDVYRQNIQRSLAAQLQQLAKQNRDTQEEYMKEVKRRKQQRADIESGDAGGSSGAGQQRNVVSQQQLQDLENMEYFATQRSQDIAHIASRVEEMNRIFRELATMVVDQGSILDQIDYNTEKMYKKSEQGKQQMDKAVKTKRKSDERAKWCFISWIIADIVGFILLLLKWQWKYGLKNVFYFLCFLAVVGVGLKFSWKHLQALCCPRLTEFLDNCDPSKLWKKIRPGPINTAKAAVAAGGGGVTGGLNAMRHVWRPPGR